MPRPHPLSLGSLLVSLTVACGGETSGDTASTAAGGSAGQTTGGQAGGGQGGPPTGQGGQAGQTGGQGGAGQPGGAGPGAGGAGQPGGATGQAGAAGISGSSGHAGGAAGTVSGEGSWLATIEVTPTASPFSGDAIAERVAVDAAGDILVVGRVNGHVEGTSIDTGDDGALLAVKLDAAGTILWTRSLPGRSIATADMTLDAAGNPVLVGSHNGGLDWGEGPRPLTDYTDMFALSLSGADGTTRWGHSWSSATYDTASAVTISPTTGDIVVMGSLPGPIDLGSGPVAGAPLVEFHLDDLGHVTLARTYDSGDSRPGVARHKSSGNLVFLAAVSGTATFGTGGTPVVVPQDGLPSPRPVIVEVDPSGVNVVTKVFSGRPLALALAMRPDDGYVATGMTMFGGIDLGSGTPGESGPFLVRYGADHAWQWERTGTGQLYSAAPVIEPSGDMLLLRGVLPGADLGDGVPAVVSETASAIVRQGENGAHQGSRLVDGAQLTSVARHPDGHAVAVGTHYAGASLGGGPLAHRGWVLVKTAL